MFFSTGSSWLIQIWSAQGKRLPTQTGSDEGPVLHLRLSDNTCHEWQVEIVDSHDHKYTIAPSMVNKTEEGHA